MTVRAGVTLQGVDRCPQCYVANPLLEYQCAFFEEYNGSEKSKVWVSYKCSSCQDLVAARITAKTTLRTSDVRGLLQTSPHYIPDITIPSLRRVDQDLPERPRRYLEQAIQSLHAPDGAIMLAGSAIDAMLKLKNYTGGSVYARIEKAVEDHVLTEGMSEWAHSVRLESNKPRHADLEEPHATKDVAEQTIKFAQALGEFLFALPAKIERGKAASTAAAEKAGTEEK